MNLSRKIKKAFRLDTYTSGAALRNLNRLHWILKSGSADIQKFVPTFLNRELRKQWRARQQTQNIDYIFAQINRQELDRINKTYASGENSIWTKYLDTRKWIERSLQQVRRLGLVLNPPSDVLDLGCGSGYFLFAVKQLGARVLGVDLDGDPIFNDMVRLLGIERVGFAVTRRVKLPEFGGRKFDLVTAWMICFNNYDRADTIWVADDWNFLLDDLSERLTPEGRIVFSMNEQLDGKFYSREIGELFARRSDLMDGRVVIFTKARLDATAKGNAKSGQFQTAGAR
ncbi:MAG TPA: methyltransferase domain-containing protein [Chthoniobacterales bacterium]|jgi:SAM-dependent methyltransferase|nr:methyltransferase domain-containing protein [Chthoniobacterales bacterium]